MNPLSRTMVSTLAAAATTLALAPAAVAHGDGHHGNDDANGANGHHRVGLRLTETARDTLDDRGVEVRQIGRGRGHHSHSHRGGSHSSSSSHGARGIAFIGDTDTVKWKRLRFDREDGTVSAKVDGVRVDVLVVEDDTASSRGDGSHERATLDLTAAGAESVNDAAGAGAFAAGDDFAVSRRC